MTYIISLLLQEHTVISSDSDTMVLTCIHAVDSYWEFKKSIVLGCVTVYELWHD